MRNALQNVESSFKVQFQDFFTCNHAKFHCTTRTTQQTQEKCFSYLILSARISDLPLKHGKASSIAQ